MKLPIIALFIAVVSVSAASSSEDVDTAWNNFKLNYEKNYRSAYEDTVRKSIFTEHVNKITEHNKLYDQGLVKYAVKINKYADMTDDEIKHTLNSYKENIYSNTNNAKNDVPPSVWVGFTPEDFEGRKIPEQINWVERGAVTAVKDQGLCASGWAFAVTGGFEGQYFRKSGKLVSLSEQQLVDCSRRYGNDGCNGGDILSSFEYVHDNDGIASEDSYSYEAVTGNCRFTVATNITSNWGLGNIRRGNESDLKAAVAFIGPITAAIDASDDDFAFYSGGIYQSNTCKNTAADLNHAVLIVGYGSENGKDYWLVKNSWGADWGEKGYLRIVRNANNNCGLASSAAWPLNYIPYYLNDYVPYSFNKN